MWYSRFLVFLDMGTSRTLLGALNSYEEKQRKAPSKSIPGAWNNQARQWDWRARADAYDQFQIAKQRKAIQVEQDEVYGSGFGLPFKRVKALKELTEKVVSILQDELAAGDINPRKHEILLQYMSAIADQKGDSKIKQEISGPDGGPVQVITEVFTPEQETDDFEEILEGEGYAS